MARCLGCMSTFKDEYQVCPYCGYEVGTPPREAYHMVPGSRLAGRYEIGRVLGFGGFGVTYIGYDTILERKVAIKEYLPSEFSTRIPGQTEITTYEGERTEQFQSGLTKFMDEAKMLAKMQESNGVVQIFNSFHENGTAYIVMEYLEGKTLKAYLEEKGTLSVDEAREILHPVITALEDVHALGIIHRDIAPDNIYLTTDGRVKLLDFGASRFATTSHSKSLSVIIKPGYAPVEQYRSRGDQGPWTDVYSLAATMYKMITGITPEDAMERVEKEELKKPSKLGIEIPKNIENALMNALNIKIEDRTQDIAAFEKELYHADKVKLHFVHLKKADVGKFPWWAKMASSVAVLAVATFGILLATGVISFSRMFPKRIVIPEGMTRVPNFVNTGLEDAQLMAAESNLVFQIVDKQYSDFVPKDMILAQNLAKGKIVDEQEIVEVVVSGGRELILLSDVCGMTQTEAQYELMRVGFDVEIVEEFSASEVGTIISQSINAGERVEKGSTVTLVVSKGYDGYIDTEMELTMPNFVGMLYEDALKEAEKLGIVLVKKKAVESNKPINTILQQTPVEGKVVHQGDKVELVLAKQRVILYVPDVQYKDEEVAKSELSAVGMTVKVEYQENATVAKGKVISQSIPADTEVQEGMSITITVSSGTKQVIIHEWSKWTDTLPANVTSSNYDIETRTQYSYRDKMYADSYSETMDGWTQYKYEMEKGEYGPWSSWSTTQPASDPNRKTETKTQYSYSDYKTCQQEDNKNAPSGYTLKSTETFYKDDWGAWSDWIVRDSIPSKPTEEIQVSNPRTEYDSRTKDWKTSDKNTMTGYTLDTSKTETHVSYGNWSDWKEGTPPQATDTLGVESETRTRQVQTGTKNTYVYSCLKVKYSGDSTEYYTVPSMDYAKCLAGSLGKTATLLEKRPDIYSETPYSSCGQVRCCATHGYVTYARPSQGGGYAYYLTKIDTEPIYKDETYTVYRTRTITTTYTYHFWKWNAWKNSWQTSEIQKTSEVDVQTRQTYQYRTRKPHYRYTFEMWTDYTAYSDTKVTDSATRKVKTQTIYRYCDKVDLKHCYFYRWTDWTNYSDEEVKSNDDREVQTKTLYRYREKS